MTTPENTENPEMSQTVSETPENVEALADVELDAADSDAADSDAAGAGETVTDVDSAAENAPSIVPAVTPGRWRSTARCRPSAAARRRWSGSG